MPGDYKRGQRLGQLIQHEIAKLLVTELKDPRVGFATVTEVRAASDLTLARVFVSILGDEKQRRDTLEGLHKARGFLRRELAHRLRLRQMPELEFELDTTLEQADRLESVFRSIHAGNNDPDEIEELDPLVEPQTNRSDLQAAAGEVLKDAPRQPKSRGRRRRRRGS